MGLVYSRKPIPLPRTRRLSPGGTNVVPIPPDRTRMTFLPARTRMLTPGKKNFVWLIPNPPPEGRPLRMYDLTNMQYDMKLGNLSRSSMNKAQANYLDQYNYKHSPTLYVSPTKARQILGIRNTKPKKRNVSTGKSRCRTWQTKRKVSTGKSRCKKQKRK